MDINEEEKTHIICVELWIYMFTVKICVNDEEEKTLLPLCKAMKIMKKKPFLPFCAEIWK